KSVKRFSDGIMLHLFDLEPDSDFRSIDLKSSGSSASRCKFKSAISFDFDPLGHTYAGVVVAEPSCRSN
ncbi:hypothetical protein, partial [Mesorhizobium sp. M7A.F.Ca.CA.002.15.1.1]|uniref:hypothetical protein n=1 Tax=Mesorhizobium sp. M7A.F.Ca.CA.002.15.1.1 TaxID=2496717 RepID=UPI0019D1E1D9